MRKLNKSATAVFKRLIDGLDKDGHAARKIDNTDGAFMPVSVEWIGDAPLGPVFSVAHYYEQNGDLMCDPDMTFMVVRDSEVFPMTYEQAGLGLYQVGARFGEDGKLLVRPRLQADQARFANMWMKNIKAQQFRGGMAKVA